MASYPPARTETRTTIRAELRWARTQLGFADSPDLDAQVLLAHVLNVGRAFLFAHGERQLSEAQSSAFHAAVARRAAGEPVAYIIGTKGFYDLDLIVTPAVLIPRPETELLLEEALRFIPDERPRTAADIGTGSGALAIAFARQRPQCTVYATDISADALAVAGRNAERHHAAVRLLRGNHAQPLIDQGIQVDLLMANLPYIATDVLRRLPVSRYEPSGALDGGADGLECIRELLTQIPLVCRSGALVLLEIGADQGRAVTALLQERLGTRSRVLPDYAGLDRIAVFQV